jgi:hypothetical protein
MFDNVVICRTDELGDIICDLENTGAL